MREWLIRFTDPDDRRFYKEVRRRAPEFGVEPSEVDAWRGALRPPGSIRSRRR